MSLEHITSEATWETFVRRFESATLAESEWTHSAHLLVAAWFVSRYPSIEAGVRIRTGIRHLNERLGGKNTSTSGFHETLTEFWIREVRAHLSKHGASLESLALLIQTPSGLWRERYTIDLPSSQLARREYVEPS